MSPQKAFVALLERALRELVAPGAETRSSTTAERCTAELLSPEGVVATFTVRVRAAPSCDPGQLALPGMGPAPAPSMAPEVEPAPALVRVWLPSDAWSRLEEGGREAYELPDVDVEATWETRGAHLTAEVPEQAARIIETMAREDALVFHRGEAPPTAKEELRSVAGPLAARAKDHATATAKPSKKAAPGSKKKPHRMTAMPEADALAQQGALVAVALQPDGHWRLWASNPEKPGGALMTSPVWKKRWDGARRADLRVRLYNRARRCTHDSLDGDIGEGES